MALIHTSKGMVDESLLEKKQYRDTSESAYADVVEWLLDGEQVKRQVTVQITKGLGSSAEQQLFG